MSEVLSGGQYEHEDTSAQVGDAPNPFAKVPSVTPASEEWVRRMADKEDGGVTSAGGLITAMAERIAVQSELLSRKAEGGIHSHEGKKYLRTIVGATPSVRMIEVDGVSYPAVEVDVYAVLEAFGVTSQPVGHALKKLLACGQRGKGDEEADLRGVLAAVNRALDQAKVKRAETSHETDLARDRR